MRKAGASLLVLSAMLFAAPAYAQFDLLEGAPALTLSMSPAHPSAGDGVKLEVRSTTLDLAQDSLAWSAGGKTIAQGVGVTSAYLTMGDESSVTTVTITVSDANGVIASTNVTITPSHVDLLFESDSYAPPFYRGRTLASAGSSLV